MGASDVDAWCKKGLATRGQTRWLAKKTLSGLRQARESPHDETLKRRQRLRSAGDRAGWRPGLFGQDQLAQLGGLQAVHRSIVVNGHGFLSLQERAAVYRRRSANSLCGVWAGCCRCRCGCHLARSGKAQGRSVGQSGLHVEFKCIAIRCANDNDSQLRVK